MKRLESDNWIYEVDKYRRKDGFYNIYIHKTSKLSGAYIGEATLAHRVTDPNITVELKDVVNLKYSM